MNDYEEILINELKPYERNARTHSKDQLDKIAASIREFGFINPVVIDENNMILVGHGRVAAAKIAGLEKVPFVRVTNLSEDKKKAYIIADNLISDLGGWDMDKLQKEVESIEMDMSQFGFDDIDESNASVDLIEDDTDSKVKCPKCGFEFED